MGRPFQRLTDRIMLPNPVKDEILWPAGDCVKRSQHLPLPYQRRYGEFSSARGLDFPRRREYIAVNSASDRRRPAVTMSAHQTIIAQRRHESPADETGR